jgi:NAD(P)-dependent dehydrogenase (short-subunit alcohol dehydrogenase family)
MEISLEGKVALVTGVGPNIGSGIALALSKYGAKVACNDMSEEAVDACVKRIERNGGTAMPVVGDVTCEDDVRGYVDDILAAWGKIDILVNNAAVMSGFASVLDETAERFSRSLLVSGLGNLLNTKYVARSMAERGIRGSIVCISSSSGWTASPGYIAYSYQKGGVNNFVRGAAMELAPYGIRVNGYTPTSPTPDNPELIAAKAAAAAASGGSADPLRYTGQAGGDEPWRRPVRWDGERPPLIPMGSTGTPTDIGHCVAWISSDYARLITGCDFVVDGGARAKNHMFLPPEPGQMYGPAPLIELDATGTEFAGCGSPEGLVTS